MSEGDTIICRCEDVTKKEIDGLIDDGYVTLDEIKRLKRCGMGPCQGRGCTQLILKMIQKKTGKKIEELLPMTARPPMKPVKIGVMAESEE